MGVCCALQAPAALVVVMELEAVVEAAVVVAAAVVVVGVERPILCVFGLCFMQHCLQVGSCPACLVMPMHSSPEAVSAAVIEHINAVSCRELP